MNLYTIIFDYRGGTYINQKIAKNEKEALMLWSNSLEVDTIKFMGRKTKEKLREEITQDILDNPPENSANVKMSGALEFMHPD